MESTVAPQHRFWGVEFSVKALIALRTDDLILVQHVLCGETRI